MRRSPKHARIAALTSGSVRQPPGADGSGTAARRCPASSSSRIEGAASAGTVGAVMRRPRRGSHAPRPARTTGCRPPPSTSPSDRSSATSRSRGAWSSGSRGARRSSRSSSPIATIAAFAGTGLGAPWKLARNSGSQRSWIARAPAQSPSSAARTRAAISPGISLLATDTTPSPPMASTASVAASSPARTATSRGRSRQMTAICSMLPLASLTAITRGCSASRRNVSALTFAPVLEGTL